MLELEVLVREAVAVDYSQSTLLASRVHPSINRPSIKTLSFVAVTTYSTCHQCHLPW